MANPLKGYEQIETTYITIHEITKFKRYLLSFIGSIYHGKRIKDIQVDATRDFVNTIEANLTGAFTDSIKVDIYAKFYEENEMNTEEQIKQEIKDAQKALERAQKKLKELENNKKYGWWKPVKEQCYYYIDNNYRVCQDNNDDVEEDHMRLESMNCFKTEKEAKLEKLQIIIRRKIQDIALRLNKGRKINWDDYSQEKYRSCIYYDPQIEVLSVSAVLCNRQAFYHPICLDKDFGEVIYNELKDDLKRCFKLQRELA